MVCYKPASHFEAKQVFDYLSKEAELCGIIPELSYLVVVNDPESLLSDDEKRLITTGGEDLQLRATFDLMPDPLRFVLKNGYQLNFDDKKFKEYMRGQSEWVSTAKELLMFSLGRRPTEIELSNHYFQSGGSLFYHIRYLLLHPENSEKQRNFLRVPRGDELHKALYDFEFSRAA